MKEKKNDITVNGEAIQAIRSEVAGLVEQANGLQVESSQQSDVANTILTKLNKTLKWADERKRDILRPLKNHIKWLEGEYKKSVAPLQEAKAGLQQRLMGWRAAEQRRIAEEEAKIRREEERRRKIQEAHAAKGHQVRQEITPVETPRPVPLEARDSTRVRKQWDFEVVDVGQVPLDYLQVDTSAVREAIRNGEREIPGLRIFQKEVPIFA